MQGQIMLDLTGGTYGPWIVTDKGDQTVRTLIDEHYSRQTVGATQFCRPGHNLVLRTPDGLGAWISWRGIRERVRRRLGVRFISKYNWESQL